MKILTIDQDAAFARELEPQVRTILPRDVERFAVAGTFAAAEAELAADAFDLVLLDPRLGGRDGLDLLSSRRAPAARTIVFSPDASVAVQAFDLGALDFVPKPVARERLAKAIFRRPAGALPPPVLSDQRLAVRRLGRIDLVPVDDLLYVEGADKYSELVLENGQRSFYDQCLGRLEATLPRSFVRIHKSYLVRFPMISRLLVLRGSRYFAVLKNGQRLPVGRSRYAHIKSRLI